MQPSRCFHFTFGAAEQAGFKLNSVTAARQGAPSTQHQPEDAIENVLGSYVEKHGSTVFVFFSPHV